MERKRIFGTQLYANFDGHITDEAGKPVNYVSTERGYVAIVIGGRKLSVAKIIAESFIGPSKKKILHLDGNKKNNAAWNLMYTSHTGIDSSNYHNLYRRLSKEVVADILSLVDKEIALEDIAERFKLKYGFILYIISKRFENNL